jgi:uncharacterized protein YndB with AHSA1/START domain
MSNPVIIEQMFSASPETVWKAITDIKQKARDLIHGLFKLY